jgi:hypothetical protein
MYTPSPNDRPLRIGGGSPTESNPDARLIGLCDHLTSAWKELEALLETQHTVEDEEGGEQVVADLCNRLGNLFDDIRAMGSPATVEGAKALAAAFSVTACRDYGTITDGGPTWMAFNVCTFFAGGAAA